MVQTYRLERFGSYLTRLIEANRPPVNAPLAALKVISVAKGPRILD